MDMKQGALDREGRTGDAPALVPPVDIVEDENGITLKADLPGVPKEGLSIRVDGDTLTFEGAVALGESSELHGVYAEVRVAQYRRSFALGRDLDTGSIDASMKNGVLTLRVAKREQAKPRRIEVKAG
ncbi:MAG TPA: Hsp20/alpha crystallin family protein [Usitatibacter sp.]|nr:Hsp20/alpha crystallin family protein [Usitatibacter sp.]